MFVYIQCFQFHFVVISKINHILKSAAFRSPTSLKSETSNFSLKSSLVYSTTRVVKLTTRTLECPTLQRPLAQELALELLCIMNM